jgi:hypothetical protein
LLRLGSRVAPSEGRPGYRRFEGTLVAPPSRAFDEVAVVDEENLIVGVARFTSRGASPLSWVPWQRSERWGFDGYVREPSAARDYRIIGIDARGSPAVLGALVVPGIR